MASMHERVIRFAFSLHNNQEIQSTQVSHPCVEKQTLNETAHCIRYMVLDSK